MIEGWLTDHGVIFFEPRPSYCDRGRFWVRVFPEHPASCPNCDIDAADMFPRYYFDLERAKAEMEAWMRARGWNAIGRRTT